MALPVGPVRHGMPANMGLRAPPPQGNQMSHLGPQTNDMQKYPMPLGQHPFAGYPGAATTGFMPGRVQNLITRLIYHWLQNGVHHGPSTSAVLEDALAKQDHECLFWFRQCLHGGLIDTMEWKEVLTRFLSDSHHWELILPFGRRSKRIEVSQEIVTYASQYRVSTIPQHHQQRLDAVASMSGKVSQPLPPVNSSSGGFSGGTAQSSELAFLPQRQQVENPEESAADTMVNLSAASGRNEEASLQNGKTPRKPSSELPARPTHTNNTVPSSATGQPPVENGRREQAQIFVANTLELIRQNKTPPELLLNLDECVFHVHSRAGKKTDGSPYLETKSLTVTPVVSAKGEIIATQAFVQPKDTFEPPAIDTQKPHMRNHRWLFSRSGEKKFSQTTPTLQQLLKEGIIPYVNEKIKEHPSCKSAVLIISCSPTRVSSEFRSWLEENCSTVQLSFVPPKTASLCQPLHRYVFRKLKLDIRMSISEYDYQVWKDASELQDEGLQESYLDDELSFDKYLQKLFTVWIPKSLENLVSEDLTRGFQEVMKDAFPFLPGFYDSSGHMVDLSQLDEGDRRKVEEKSQATLDFAHEVLKRRDDARRSAVQPRGKKRKITSRVT